jgi:glycosyltransferase involved in cell wall biosynthesis
MSGIEVIRVWSYMTANEGFAKRVLDYVSFMLSATIAGLFVKRPDVIVGTSPQLFTAVAARLLSGMRRIPWVFELRDIWPESIKAVSALGSESRVIRLLEKLELHLYRNASRIVAVTHAFKANLVGRGIDPAKIHVVTNGVDLSRYGPREKDAAIEARLDLKGKFVAGYVGTHGMAHSLETLIDTAALLAARPDGRDIRILMIGDGARKAELVANAAERGLANLLFLDSVGKDQIIEYWSILDAAVIHLRKTPLFETVIPSKLFEAMGMGLPIVMGVAGEAGEIVRAGETGVLFEPENAAALADALVALANDRREHARLGANALRVAKQYDRSYLASQMLGVLEGIKWARDHRKR